MEGARKTYGYPGQENTCEHSKRASLHRTKHSPSLLT